MPITPPDASLCVAVAAPPPSESEPTGITEAEESGPAADPLRALDLLTESGVLPLPFLPPFLACVLFVDCCALSSEPSSSSLRVLAHNLTICPTNLDLLCTSNQLRQSDNLRSLRRFQVFRLLVHQMLARKCHPLFRLSLTQIPILGEEDIFEEPVVV